MEQSEVEEIANGTVTVQASALRGLLFELLNLRYTPDFSVEYCLDGCIVIDLLDG